MQTPDTPPVPNSPQMACCQQEPCSPSPETERLRSIFPKILKELESGGCSADCSIEFLEMIPNEVALVVAKMKRERDAPRHLHAYANAQRKAADNDRMNAEETVSRIRLKVDELREHGKDACEYTDGWEDALLKVRDEFPPERLGHPRGWITPRNH